jgi:hypothetical protein
MKERERQPQRQQPAPTGSSGADDLDAAREQGARLLAAGDDAIERALSADSRAFLRANRQQGGE